MRNLWDQGWGGDGGTTEDFFEILEKRGEDGLSMEYWERYSLYH